MGGTRISTAADLTAHFRSYLRLLNTRVWTSMGMYLAPRMQLNGRRVSRDAYTRLIPPFTTFSADEIIADAGKRTIAVRLNIEVPHPDGQVDSLREHVFYHFNEAWAIDQVWSVYAYGDPPPSYFDERRTSDTSVGSGSGSGSRTSPHTSPTLNADEGNGLKPRATSWDANAQGAKTPGGHSYHSYPGLSFPHSQPRR